MQRQVIIYTDENGEWCASCPSLPGCHSQGETREETIINIRDAVESYCDALEEPAKEELLDDLQQSLRDALKGCVLPADEVIEALRRKHQDDTRK